MIQKNSYFDGSLLQLIGVGIIQFLMILFTFGIATPWAVCYHERWIANHSVIESKRLKFNGTGGELFGKFIIWMLLTIITIGIYGFWLSIKMKKWVASHYEFEN